MIIRSDGTIVTNNHVIARATITGQDASADIAVIKATGVSGLKPSP